ncbi:MAG TPA: dihydrofolate reductase, partial [Oceanospirillales bacterium]|nr:dihydrofolate reductase [Oceanospirillales bacterium]
MDENNLIGSNNDLPWKLPADLKYFKQQTLNKTILMGRKTCESLPFALPKRRNVVLTRNINFTRQGFETIHHIDSINEINDDIMVIGGALIYKLLMPYAKTLLITKIHHKFSGDTYFQWNPKDWTLVKTIDNKADAKNLYDYSFLTYQK